MISASVGVGTGPDAYTAGEEACRHALGEMPKERAHALFVFGSVALDQDKLIEGVSSLSGDALLIGCSSAGEISSEGFSAEKSVVVMAIASDQVQFCGAVGHHILWNPRRAGEECASGLQYASHGYTHSALAFLDIISGNGDLTLSGFLNRLGGNVPVFGGAAGDDMLFFQTFQYLKDKTYSGSIVGMGLSGNFTTAQVTMHGFLPIGIERIVTKSEGTTLYELDGKPAASIYKEYFGEEHLSELHEGLLPSITVSYPLGVFLKDSDEVLLRNPIFIDKKGAMTFTAAIPQGAEIRLMISDIERDLEVTELAAQSLLKKLNGKKPKAALVVNSMARKKMLGARADEEIEIIQRVLGRDVPFVGFYSYAQIGERAKGEVALHNGALSIWALAE